MDDRVADLVGRAKGGTTGGQIRGNRRLDLRRRLGEPEVVEHHRDGKDRRSRIGDSPTGDVRRGAVDGLEHGGVTAAGVDVSAGSQADAAGYGGPDVGEDVAEEVVRDDDIEATRLADEEHGSSIDVAVIDGDVGEVG